MVKNRVNIVLICIRAGGHSKPELRLEIIHYTLVAVVAGTMALVEDYYIKLILGELLVYLWFRHHLHSREQKVSIHFAAGPGNQAISMGRSENLLIAFDRLFCDLFSVYDE